MTRDFAFLCSIQITEEYRGGSARQLHFATLLGHVLGCFDDEVNTFYDKATSAPQIKLREDCFQYEIQSERKPKIRSKRCCKTFCHSSISFCRLRTIGNISNSSLYQEESIENCKNLLVPGKISYAFLKSEMPLIL